MAFHTSQAKGTPFDSAQGKLSIVATPIGNLGDITLRALDTLKRVDVIACEDTRVTAKLLQKYGIEKPLVIYHAQSGRSRSERVLALLGEGKHVALVSDAGTPGVLDPGSELVTEVRARLHDHVRIETIPGPAALAAALSIAGVPANTFLFLGFLPHKKGRETLFKLIAKEERTVVFYESVHRIEKALQSLAKTLPAGRAVTVCRELTKIHESVVQGTPAEVVEHFKDHSDQIRGEFVVIVSA